MEGGQKKDLPLNSPLDTKSSDMLVSVDQPKFAHNRQQYQGHVLPTSLRFEHNGWAAGEQVYEFEFEGGRITETGADPKVELSRTRLNGNPAYILNLYELGQDNKLATICFNFATSGNCIDVPNLTVSQPTEGDRSNVIFEGTFNDKQFSFEYNVLDETITVNTPAFEVEKESLNSGIVTFKLTDLTDSITVDTEDVSKVIFPSKLYNKDGNYALGDVTGVQSNENGKHSVIINNGSFTIDNIDLNGKTIGEATVTAADANVKGITAPSLADDSSLPVEFDFNKDTENDAQVTGSVTDKIIYIKDLTVKPEYPTTIQNSSESTAENIAYLNRLNSSFVSRRYNGVTFPNDIVTAIPFAWDKYAAESPSDLGTRKEKFFANLNSSLIDVEVPTFMGTRVLLKNNIDVVVDESNLTNQFTGANIPADISGVRNELFIVSEYKTKWEDSSVWEDHPITQPAVVYHPSKYGLYRASVILNSYGYNPNTRAAVSMKNRDNVYTETTTPMYYISPDSVSGNVWYNNKDVTDLFDINCGSLLVTIDLELEIVFAGNNYTWDSADTMAWYDYEITAKTKLTKNISTDRVALLSAAWTPGTTRPDLLRSDDPLVAPFIEGALCDDTFRCVISNGGEGDYYELYDANSEYEPIHYAIESRAHVKSIRVSKATIHYPTNPEQTTIDSVSFIYNSNKSFCLVDAPAHDATFQITVNIDSNGVTSYSPVIDDKRFIVYTGMITNPDIIGREFNKGYMSACLFKGHVLKKIQISDSVEDTITAKDINLVTPTLEELSTNGVDASRAYLNFMYEGFNSYNLFDLKLYGIDIDGSNAMLQLVLVSADNSNSVILSLLKDKETVTIDGTTYDFTDGDQLFMPAKYVYPDTDDTGYYDLLVCGIVLSGTPVLQCSECFTGMLVKNNYTALLSGANMYQCVFDLEGVLNKVRYIEAQSIYVPDETDKTHKYFEEVLPLLQDSYTALTQSIYLNETFSPYYIYNEEDIGDPELTQDEVLSIISSLTNDITPVGVDTDDIEVYGKICKKGDTVIYAKCDPEDLFSVHSNIIDNDICFSRMSCPITGVNGAPITVMGKSVKFQVVGMLSSNPSVRVETTEGGVPRTYPLESFYYTFLAGTNLYDFTEVLPMLLFTSVYSLSESAAFVQFLNTNHPGWHLALFLDGNLNYVKDDASYVTLVSYIEEYLATVTTNTYYYDIPDATSKNIYANISELRTEVLDKYTIYSTVSFDSNGTPIFKMLSTLLYEAGVVVPRLTYAPETEDGTRLKFITWDNNVFTFKGTHNNEEYTVTYNQNTQETILYYKTYILPVTGSSLQLPALTDNTYLESLGLSRAVYTNKVLDYILFTRGVDTAIFAKMYGPYSTTGDINIKSITDNLLTIKYNGVPAYLQPGTHTFDLTHFNDNNAYLNCFVTDVNDPESYDLSTRKHIGKIDAKEEFQLIKQAWNTTTAVENYWWITEGKILYLTKDAFVLMKKVEALDDDTVTLDDWNGDKWEQDTTWNRTTFLPSTVVQYGVTNINGSDATGAKLWTLTPTSDDTLTFKVYTLLDSFSAPLVTPAVQEYSFDLVKKDITKSSDLLNTDYNQNKLYSYSSVNVYDMAVAATISTTVVAKASNRYLIIGIHYDTNFGQWSILIDLNNNRASHKIVQGYGFVGIDGSLTGGEIPDKYFTIGTYGGGFNSRVLDTGILTSEVTEVENPATLSQFASRIVGNENQQWYIDKDIDGIVSHLTFDVSQGKFNKVILPIHNNYDYCYESPSFMTRVAGDVSIQMKPLLSLMPVNSKQNQWIWNLLFGYIGAPLMYYINPKISYVNYLQQTFGQYAYVHYNSTSLYQAKDLQKNDIVSPLESADTGVETAVTKDELSFDVYTISQTQDCGSSPWEELFYLLGTSLTTALDYTKEKLKVNEQQNQSATTDKGNKYSQMFLKNLESMSKAAFTSRSYTPTLVSEVTMLKTLDMFYSTSAKQHVYAGPGFVNHNFVAQCVAQSAVNTQLEGNQLSILAIFTPLTTFQMRLEMAILKKTAEYLRDMVQAFGGPLWSFGGAAGAGFSVSAIIASALALAEKGVELSYHAIEVAIPAVEHILNSLGGNHLTSTITNTLSNHNVELEAKHRYGSNSEVFMWPCFDCKDNIFVREKVVADTVSKPWNLSMNPVSKFIPTNATNTVKIVKQLSKYTNGWVNLSDNTTPSTNTIRPSATVSTIAYGEVDYRIAVCRGEIEDTILPEGMACVIGSDNFLPSDNFKNENIGESEPVFATPVIQDYVISKDWRLAMTCTAGEIAWVSCKDTKLIDGAPSNMIISDDFCGIAAPYTAIEVKRELSVDYLRPWAVTPNVLALNVTGLNTAFDKKMYHAFDGYGYRITSWYGAPGMNKEKYNLLYTFQINDRFKRSNKLPPNQFLGNFKSEPDTTIQSLDKIFNQVMVPSENEGMDAGTVGEDKAVVRYSLPIFSEFISTLPAIVKTLSSYKLAVVDGVTSLCTDLRNTQSAYKTSVSTDFNIASKQYRVTNDYICSVDNSSGVTVLQELVATLGLTYLGATLTEAYFYSPATRKYYSYTGGANLNAVDMLERFRDIKNGIWDFVNHEVAMPCLATFDRLDSNVSDDEDETDNIIIPMIKGNEFIGEITPPITTIFNTSSWFRTLSLPAGLTFQGPNRCIINRFIYMEYMNAGIKNNRGRWKRVPKEVYHPFRKYKEEYQDVTNYIDDESNDNVIGWTHNPFLLVTSPLGVNEETDCLFEWEITFAWTVEMDRLYAQDEYVCVNLMSETMTPGGKVYNRPTHIYLTKELFTRTGNYGYYSFRYEGNNGIGNRERLHIWSDGYIAVSSIQVEYKPMTDRRQTKLTQYVDVQQLNEF